MGAIGPSISMEGVGKISISSVSVELMIRCFSSSSSFSTVRLCIGNKEYRGDGTGDDEATVALDVQVSPVASLDMSDKE